MTHETNTHPYNFVSLPEEAEVTVMRLGTEALVQRAFKDIEAQRQSEQLWPSSAILSSNDMVSDRQIRLVDCRTELNPSVKAYLKLENWAEIYTKVQGIGEDSSFMFGTKGDQSSAHQPRLQARRMQVGEARVSLIHGESTVTTDGLVEISIPMSHGKEETEVATELNKTLESLTGEPVWDDRRAGESLRKWKYDTFRKYLKLPEGPLTAEQAELANNLHIEQTSPTTIALKAPGMHQALRFETSLIYPRHESRNENDAIEAIINGQLLSTERRQEQGLQRRGRSSDADMLYGGGEVVYTYASTKEGAYSVLTGRTPRFVLRPEALDRLDVRAYETDAYGSKQSSEQTPIDQIFKRDRASKYATTYQDRVEPKDFKKLRGVHELCFEGSVSLNECLNLVVPVEDNGSFNEVNWQQELKGFVADGDPTYPGRYRDMAVKSLQHIWGSPQQAMEALAAHGISEDRIARITAGMNLPPRERIIAKLKQQGVDKINGRPVEEFVVYAEELDG